MHYHNKMGFGKFIRSAITYTSIFFAGYYVGGGCESSPLYAERERNQSIEKRLENYETRITDLEEKFREKNNGRWIKSTKRNTNFKRRIK